MKFCCRCCCCCVHYFWYYIRTHLHTHNVSHLKRLLFVFMRLSNKRLKARCVLFSSIHVNPKIHNTHTHKRSPESCNCLSLNKKLVLNCFDAAFIFIIYCCFIFAYTRYCVYNKKNCNVLLFIININIRNATYNFFNSSRL